MMKRLPRPNYYKTTKNIFRVSRTGLVGVKYNQDGSIVCTKTAICTRQATQIGVSTNSNSKTIPGTVIFTTPMSQKWNYFEIKIIEEGSFCEIGIGVGPLNYSQQMMPGWGDMSIGYHADDGRLFISTGKGHAFGLCCGIGDTMGCGVDYSRQKHGYVSVWFTRNGELAGPPEKFPLPKDGLYPLIGLSSLNESVLYTGHSNEPLPCSEVPAAPTAPGTYQSVRVKVVYPYEAVLEDELTILPGDIIHVEERLGDWWRGRNRNHCKSGLFYKDFTVPYCPEEEESPCKWLDADDKPRNPVGFPVTFMEREYRVQSRPGDELECMICNSLSNNPHQTGCCGHTVCYNCAAQWRRRNNSCPNCQRMPLELAVDPRTKRHILSLTVYCPHYEIGCDWIGSFSNANTHLQHHCPLEVVKCEHKGCSRMLQRKDLNDHMREKCLMRPVECPCCDLGSGREKSRDWDDGWLVGIVRTVSSLFVPQLTYDQLVGHHYRECEKWPLRCPNRCNTEERLTRSTVNAHLKDNCPEHVISCQFAEAGCTVRVKRKEMADHIQQSVGEHMTAMMSDYIKVKKELRQLKNEYSDLKQDHERLKDRVGRVEKTKSTSYFYN